MLHICSTAYNSPLHTSHQQSDLLWCQSCPGGWEEWEAGCRVERMISVSLPHTVFKVILSSMSISKWVVKFVKNGFCFFTCPLFEGSNIDWENKTKPCPLTESSLLSKCQLWLSSPQSTPDMRSSVWPQWQSLTSFLGGFLDSCKWVSDGHLSAYQTFIDMSEYRFIPARLIFTIPFWTFVS